MVERLVIEKFEDQTRVMFNQFVSYLPVAEWNYLVSYYHDKINPDGVLNYVVIAFDSACVKFFDDDFGNNPLLDPPMASLKRFFHNYNQLFYFVKCFVSNSNAQYFVRSPS